MDQTKPLFIAFGPLVIVQKRPVEKPLYVRAVCDGLFCCGEVSEKEILTNLVGYSAILKLIGIGHAVFGDIDRSVAHIIARHAGQKVVQAFGVNLPAHLGAGAVAGNIAQGRPWRAGGMGVQVAGVVVDAQPIKLLANDRHVILPVCGHMGGKALQHVRGIGLAGDPFDEPAVEDPVPKV